METPRPNRRTVAAGLAAALATLPALAPLPGLAQDFPSRPVTIVVPYGPGSYTDLVLRPFAPVLQKLLGQPVVIDNKAGGNGVIGSQFVARARPDGYTLLAGSSTTLAANAGLFRALPYDPLKDFQPVAGLASTSMMFLVRADAPARDLKSFLAHAARQPQPLAVGYGSSSAQVALAQLAKASGVRFTPVPYKATPQAMTDLIGGQVPAAISDVSNGVPHVRAGKLAALAISAGKRSLAAPEVPTLDEAFPGTQLVTWIGLVAPAGTPPAVVERIGQAVTAALASPELRQQMAALSTDLEPMSATEMGRRMQQDHAQWLDLIRAAGIQPE
ncbi:Bug family tripartite tricarboxylate transporter substrate binding protein [Ramlibacter sp. MAHUQ-53]|uniref:Bug family tripartite tricarboxylate transporter substrate binding protein n=1 Tax=unclassified Ramlibacter TaxID=2617605 RepID=UPI003640C935